MDCKKNKLDKKWFLYLISPFILTSCYEDKKIEELRFVDEYLVVSIPPSSATAVNLSDFQLEFPRRASFPPGDQGSSHEIIFDPISRDAMWVTSPNLSYS
jgi:hypothetical protein